MPTTTRRLAAIMFTDIVGYTAMMESDEEYTLKILEKNRLLHKELLLKHDGELLKEIGDGMLVCFSSSVNAVFCALDIMKSTEKDSDLNYRIGIHQGDVIFSDGDVYGDGVNVASRIESQVPPGKIYISEQILDNIKNIKKIDVKFVGKRKLKNITRLLKLFELFEHKGGEKLIDKMTGGKFEEDEKPTSLVKRISGRKKSRRKEVIVSSIIVLIILIFFSVTAMINTQRRQWVNDEALPLVENLLSTAWSWNNKDITYFFDNHQNAKTVFDILTKASRYFPTDTVISDYFNKCTRSINLVTKPNGADVYYKPYGNIESSWAYIGKTPIQKKRIPEGLYEMRITLNGYDSIQSSYATWRELPIIKLEKEGVVPSNMKHIPDTSYWGLKISEFFIDTYEVTNVQYKEFMNDRGYETKKFWNHEFVMNGKTLSWEEAIEKFIDRTGRKGPSGWAGGIFPEGKENFPVSGICWYEAAAYAEWAGKALPSIYHWGAAAEPEGMHRFFMNTYILKCSNFSDEGPMAVNLNRGINSHGLFDMAGNVREWCYNKTGNGYTLRGGAWNDAPYMYSNITGKPGFDRSEQNGFRCMKIIKKDSTDMQAFDDLEWNEKRDLRNEKAVSNDIFNIYKNQFLYDSIALDPRILKIDSISSNYWKKEFITFNAAYRGPRMKIVLFLPKGIKPPYQTVIYFPGSIPDIKSLTSKDLLFQTTFDFIIKNGRALVYPIYLGTYERHENLKSNWELRNNYEYEYLDYIIKVVKDFKSTIDYLETRDDIVHDAYAYFGFSWGGALGIQISAIETRLKASILYLGGVNSKSLPEIDEVNYLPRINVPILMLNGKYDMAWPFETNVEPAFQLIGADQKELKIYETDHFIPKEDLVKETLDWYDRYLGPVKK